MLNKLRCHKILSYKVITVLIISNFLCYISMAAENPKAVFTASQLQEKLANQNSNIYSWYIEYNSVHSDDFQKPLGAYLHRIVAASRSGDFFHWSAKGTSNYSWQDDPLQQRLTITSSSAFSEVPIDRAFRVLKLKPNDTLPGTSSQELLFVALGWWPFEQRATPKFKDNAPCVLKDVAICPKYTVRPLQQLINGHWCHLLEHRRHDRLWLDVERNCAILAREILDHKTGNVLQRIELTKHQEVISGIWVPMEIRNIVFDEQSNNEVQHKLVDATAKILNIQINVPLPRKLLDFTPLPGSIQVMDDHHFEKKVPGGFDY